MVMEPWDVVSHEMGTARMGNDRKTSGTQQMEPGMGLHECICYRWCVYDFRSLSKSVTHLYGINSKSS